MTIKNNLLLGGDLSDYTPPDGAVDFLGIKYSGPVLGEWLRGWTLCCGRRRGPIRWIRLMLRGRLGGRMRGTEVVRGGRGVF